METERAVLEQAIERGRQDVLAGMLLHVVPTASRVDGTADAGPGCQRAVEDMENLTALVHHVDDAYLAERAGVVRLAARRRVEGRLVQDHRDAAIHVACSH